jgi:hypothetical protein
MLDTTEFVMKTVTDIVMVVAIVVLSTALIRERRRGRWVCEGWTSADRGVMRKCRTVMWSGAALAWAAVLATIAHEPGLIREPLLVNVTFMPLILTFMATTWNAPRLSANLHNTRHFRALMILGTAVVCLGLAASLLALFNAWTMRV